MSKHWSVHFSILTIDSSRKINSQTMCFTKHMKIVPFSSLPRFDCVVGWCKLSACEAHCNVDTPWDGVLRRQVSALCCHFLKKSETNRICGTAGNAHRSLNMVRPTKWWITKIHHLKREPRNTSYVTGITCIFEKTCIFPCLASALILVYSHIICKTNSVNVHYPTEKISISNCPTTQELCLRNHVDSNHGKF